MPSPGESSSPLPCVGMTMGLLLLGFAGYSAVVQPSTSFVVPEPAGQVGQERRLQFGYITTSKAPSSFDSSDSSSSGSSLEPSKSSESGSLESSEWHEMWKNAVHSLGSSV